MRFRRRILVQTLTIAAAGVGALGAVVIPATLAAPAAARGSLARAPRPNASVEIGTAQIKGLGTVLVRGDGHVVYMFAPFGGAKVGCTAACQKVWPPVYGPRTGVAKAISGARQKLIGSARDPVNGRQIVTYAGWPLYTYVLDQRPHLAGGQNVLLNGGFWWVLTAAGKIVRTPVSHGGGYVGS